MSSTHNKSRAWVVVAFFTVSMALVSFNLMLYPACTFDTMKMYGIEQVGITTLSAVVSLTGLCCGLIMGPIIDRIGSRKVVTISLIMAVILFFARVFITSFTAALILTFFASFFLGVCQVAAPKVLDTWYTKENVGTAVSFQAGGAGMGSAVVFAIGAGCGLKTTLLIMTFAALALLIFWIVAGYNGPIEVRKTELPKKAALKIYKSKCVWLLAISYACCVSACATINTYLINAFASTGRVTPEQASLMATLMAVSLLAGGYLATFALQKLKRFNLILAVCVLGGAAGHLLCWFLPDGPQTWIFLIMGGLIMGGGILMCVGRSPLIPLTGEIPYELIGTVSGAFQVIKGVIAFFVPILIASICGTNFSAVFICFAVLCVIAFLTGAVFVPEMGAAGKLFKEAEAKKKSIT